MQPDAGSIELRTQWVQRQCSWG